MARNNRNKNITEELFQYTGHSNPLFAKLKLLNWTIYTNIN